MFSGIGAFEKALKRQRIDYELVNFCEVDKWAIKSYCLIHNESKDKNLGDITKVDLNNLPSDVDIITHGSPCTDYSIAGKQEGGNEGSGTRSSLMWNSVQIIKKCNPKYVIWENVKNVLSAKHKHNFDKYISDLDDIGYNSYYKVLNAKMFGVPQNRERIFVVSIRKDIDNYSFKFPEGFDSGIRLKDVLEDVVDEKYYLSNKGFNYVTNKYNQFIKNNGYTPEMFNPYNCAEVKNISPTVTTQCGSTTSSATVLINNNYRIRKLTPLECIRLMDFNDEDYYILKENKISDTQIYKMCGNSIVVSVLEHIFKNLFNN